jgi:YVTN family beta-propeller protein
VSTPLLKVIAPVGQLPIAKKIAIPGGADWIGIGFDSVWIKTPSQVIRVNQATNSVAAKIDAATCRGFGEGFGRMWTTDCGNGAILAIDPATNKVSETIKVRINGGGEGSIGVGEGGIWVVSGENDTSSGTLTRIDPVTRKIVANIPVSPGSNGVTVGGGAVWVSNTDDGSVSKIDPATNKVDAVIKVHKSPRFITSDGKFVWVLNQGDGSVSKINPATNAVVATIDVGVPGGGGDIKAGAGAIWVTAPGTPVSRIDPGTDKVTHQYTGGAGDALNAGYDSVWLPAYGDAGGELWRIDAKKLAKQGPTGLLAPH